MQKGFIIFSQVMNYRTFEILKTNGFNLCLLKSTELAGFDLYFEILTDGTDIEAFDF